MTDKEMRLAAKKFVQEWTGRGYEKGESQKFWIQLLQDVLGAPHDPDFIQFEEQVHLDNTSFIDAMIPSTRIMIEQKSLGKNLNMAIRQSDGTFLTPFTQAKRYIVELPVDKHPYFVVTSNFAEIWVYNMRNPQGEPEKILLKDLPTEYYRLKFLVDTGSSYIEKEMEISLQAGEIVGELYDGLLKRYKNPESDKALKSLNVLLTRLVFCFYAESAGIFGSRTIFHDYLKDVPANKIRTALRDLFKVLNQKLEERDLYLEDDNPILAAFPYVNGGLFADDDSEIPPFDEETKKLLMARAMDFDWEDLSPTIFGALMESTLNPVTRRSGGMHFTSVDNIRRLIHPLFLDDLEKEFEEIKAIRILRTQEAKLKAFQEKLASLTFLDPACGSGNFLTETYLCLRRMENDVIALLNKDQIIMGDMNPIKVSIGQFYGIEINDFAVSVARTALWIAESQMMRETEGIVDMDLDFLPLRSYAHIVEGNALRIDWEEVVPKSKLSYIMGNPPFVGASMMTKEQKAEAVAIFGKVKRSHSIDYVGAWYHKAASFMQGTSIRAALVSTNSITQGEQVAGLWGRLFSEFGVHIDFAHRTFRWDSEAALKAHVHCVIIGFSVAQNNNPRLLYSENRMQIVSNINGYLLDGDNICVESRSSPICAVPEMRKGNQPSDGGNLILSEEERNALVKKDSSISVCIRRYMGSMDFINGKPVRYCLWLRDISPAVYRRNTEIMRRLEAVKQMRLASSAAPTRALSEKPYLFFSSPQTDGNYLCIPEVSSIRRKYIPIGFMDENTIASNKLLIIMGATLYHFGVLTSNVHMAWTRTVGGRLKSDFSYSGAVVYNTFPWPEPTPEQRARIEQTAQAILDARARFPDSSLADLYDDLTMPPDLRKAHQLNDKAVMEAYGLPVAGTTESDCVAFLMRRYQELSQA